MQPAVSKSTQGKTRQFSAQHIGGISFKILSKHGTELLTYIYIVVTTTKAIILSKKIMKEVCLSKKTFL